MLIMILTTNKLLITSFEYEIYVHEKIEMEIQ